MFEIFWYIISVYLFSFFLGLGPLVLLRPQYLKDDYLIPWLAPFYGQAILVLCGTYVFCFNLDIKYAFYLSSVLSGVILLVLFFYRRTALLSIVIDTGAYIKGFKLPETAAFFIGSIALLLPIFEAGMASSPFRFGPDIAQYNAMAKYLMDGGIYNNLLPLQVSSNTGEIVLYDSFVRVFHWGYVFALTGYCKLTGCMQPYKMTFLMLLMSYIMSGVFVFHLLRRFVGLSWRYAFWLSAAFVFNGNLIYLYYEAYWAHIFAMPALVLLFTALLEVRSLSEKKLHTELIVSGIIIFTILLLNYSEMALLVGPTFLVILFFADFLFDRKKRADCIMFYFKIALWSLLVILPAIPALYTSLFRSIFWVAHAGGSFVQPMWAMPSEIMGFTSIYGKLHNISAPQPFAVEISRTLLDAIINVLVSVLLVAGFLLTYIRSSKPYRNFYLTAALMVLMAYISRKLLHQHAYLYLKMYTFLLPLLLVGLADAFFNRDIFKFAELRRKMGAIFICCTVASGFLTIYKYNNSCGYLGKDLIGFHNFLEHSDLVNNSETRSRQFVFCLRLLDKNKAVSKTVQNDVAIELMAVCSNFRMLYLPENVDYLQLKDMSLKPAPPMLPFLGENTLFLLERKDLDAVGVKVNPLRRILYSDNRFILVDSGQVLNAFVETDASPAKATFGLILQ